MEHSTFKRILKGFADSEDEITYEKGCYTFIARDEAYEVFVEGGDGGVQCREGSDMKSVPAAQWIAERLARLPLLATRMLDYLDDDDCRIPVRGRVFDVMDKAPDEEGHEVDDAMDATIKLLTQLSSQLATGVVYLTSDAGEGKTNLITALARKQAHSYIQGASSWLLLPITLGGRPFIRLDDIVIGSLANQFRFPFLYFQNVIDLCRIGRVVLALDGFEEMFVVSRDGEAVSSIGSLMSQLESEGRVLVAARRAFFHFRNLEDRATIFRSIGQNDVTFVEVNLQRWRRTDLIRLAQCKTTDDLSGILDQIAASLRGDGHPLLTRAVLARRLVDEIASRDADGRLRLAGAVENTSSGENEYFYQFVTALLEREANEKWIDRSGDAAKPLLSIDEHHRLLSDIAEEMWISKTESLPLDVLEITSEFSVESMGGKSPEILEQVRKRVHQHAFLAPIKSTRRVRFDHDDFREFYLGLCVGKYLAVSGVASRNSLKNLLQTGVISNLSTQIAVSRAFRSGQFIATEAIAVLSGIAIASPETSYARINCGKLSLCIAEMDHDIVFQLSSMFFDGDSLIGRTLSRVVFDGCHFQTTSLSGTRLSGVEFRKCCVERLDLAGMHPLDCVLFDVESVPRAIGVDDEEDSQGEDVAERVLYDPVQIRGCLLASGFGFDVREVDGDSLVEFVAPVDDVKLVVAMRILRAFYRNTGINTGVMRARAGARFHVLEDDVLPALLQHKILLEGTYRGAGTQNRYRLNVNLDEIERAYSHANGLFEEFLRLSSQKIRV